MKESADSVRAATAATKLSRTTLAALEREHGDSFYLVDLNAFRNNYLEFLSAFRELYPNTNIAYSYKTNYTPKLCQMVRQWGGYAEVVSRMEYELAQRVGVDPERIIFNGPYKSPNDVERALTLGSVVNVDWPYQLGIVDAVARNFPERQLRVGVRVTFEIPSNQPSRFGFNADNGALSGILAQLRALPNVEVAGLHCHFLTPHRSITDYRFIASRMLELTAKHFREPPAFVNVGGGYFSKMKRELQEQFGISVPTYRQYAEAIAAQVAASYPNGFAPELILEPGICLTADVVKFIARVIDVHVSGPRRLVLVSGSIYDIKPTLNARNLPLEFVHAEDGGRPTLSGRFDIVGYTCMENDVLFRGFEGTLGVGDYAVFQNVGAYTNVLRPPFIRECPPMLGWNYETNAFEILKRMESFNDVFATYTFDEKLTMRRDAYGTGK